MACRMIPGLAGCGGGLAVVRSGEVLGLLPLPLGGLLSLDGFPAVGAEVARLHELAAGLGVPPGRRSVYGPQFSGFAGHSPSQTDRSGPGGCGTQLFGGLSWFWKRLVA